jgi:hypothetical protein
MTDCDQDLLIGRYTNLQDEGIQLLPGAIEEVTIWNSALTADEIAELHTLGPDGTMLTLVRVVSQARSRPGGVLLPDIPRGEIAAPDKLAETLQ